MTKFIISKSIGIEKFDRHFAEKDYWKFTVQTGDILPRIGNLKGKDKFNLLIDVNNGQATYELLNCFDLEIKSSFDFSVCCNFYLVKKNPKLYCFKYENLEGYFVEKEDFLKDTSYIDKLYLNGEDIEWRAYVTVVDLPKRLIMHLDDYKEEVGFNFLACLKEQTLYM